MGEAVVERLGQHALGLAGQPGRLGLDRLLERQRLEAAGDLVLVVRVGPPDRVAQQRDQLDPGQVLGHPLGHERVEQVVGAGLAGSSSTPWRLATHQAVSLVGKREAYQPMPLP